jgi:hypothetical protein
VMTWQQRTNHRLGIVERAFVFGLLFCLGLTVLCVFGMLRAFLMLAKPTFEMFAGAALVCFLISGWCAVFLWKRRRARLLGQ